MSKLLLLFVGFGVLIVGGLMMKVLVVARNTKPGRAYWTRFYNGW